MPSHHLVAALLMGFLNYSLSLALALFAFAAWVRWEGWRWRALAMVPIGFVVWLCHVSGLGRAGRAGVRLRVQPQQLA